MKTHTIKTPTAELLILELPEHGNTFDDLTLLNSETEGYTLLGKPAEIREEDAAQIIPMYFDYEKTAVEYLIEMIESEIYWDVNPYGTRESNTLTEGGHEIWAYSDEHYSKWREAEQKIFDRNRSIILVKQ